MIKFDNVSKIYNKNSAALKNINLEIEMGELAFLTGHSGAGKSTMLKLIMGLTQPSSGQIIINNTDISRLNSGQSAVYRRHIGMIMQSPMLLPNKTVFANIEVPLLIAGIEDGERKRLIRAALDKVNLLHKEKALVPTLSSGEQQRVSIARAVVTKPNIILADEPTGNLDPAQSIEIIKLFEAFRQVGVSILIATHDLALIARMKYRIITLVKGKIIGIDDNHTEITDNIKETEASTL